MVGANDRLRPNARGESLQPAFLSFAARTFAQRALCAFAILARPAADILRLGVLAATAFNSRTLAHRAFVALEMASLPAADILRRFLL